MNDPLPFPVDTRLVLFALHDAIEGGSCSLGMGWAQLESYRWSQWYEPDKELDTPNANLTKDTVLVRVREVDDDGYGKWVDLTLGKMEEAIRWTLTNYSHLGGFSINQNVVDDWDYDAISADVALQKAVLGEVIYG